VGVALAVVGCAGGTGPREGAGPKVPSTASELAVETYVYAYPLLVFDRERQAQVQALGANNRLSTRTTTATPFSHDVLAPNADTVSTTALIDLRSGPLVLSVPDSGDRYTRIDLLDAYTHIFASLGQRTEGNAAANFAIVGPTGASSVSGVTTVKAPTNHVWLHGQVAAQGERDVPAASGLMRQWALTPASEFAAGKRRLADERPSLLTSKGRGESRRGAAAHLVLRGCRAAVADQPPGGRRRSARQEVSLDRRRLEVGTLQSGEAERAGAGEGGERRSRAHPRGEDGRDAGEWMEFQRGGRELRRRSLVARAAARTGIGGALPQDGLEASARVDASNARLQGGSRYVLTFSKNGCRRSRLLSLTLLDDEAAWSTT
jgi:hypothetical protein